MRSHLVFVLLVLILTPYHRSDWKHWIDADRDCQDTRQEVLIRSSIIDVTFKSNRHCIVISGMWFDPYTGKVFFNPKKLDIDHFVPLRNAHFSGASTWNKKKKERYANYLQDRTHLIAVSARANRQKGARGPERWMPPNKHFHCVYVKEWKRIKKEWRLSQNELERKKIKEVETNCTAN